MITSTLKKTFKHSAFLFLFFTLQVSPVFILDTIAQTADKSNPSPLKFPTPKGIANQLFYLQRDPNLNTLIYELNLDKSGNLIESQPILAYWIRYDENQAKKDLSYVQKKFAYGIDAKKLGKDQFELRFVSHKKLPLYLSKSADDKKYHVYVTINNKKLLLDRIFVRIEGGSFWIPNVKYVELRGINQANETVVTERIIV
jgi:phosphoribosyl-ATP pyrophosphohydrolase